MINNTPEIKLGIVAAPTMIPIDVMIVLNLFWVILIQTSLNNSDGFIRPSPDFLSEPSLPRKVPP